MREKSPNILLTRVGRVEIAAYGAAGCAFREKESRSGVSSARILFENLVLVLGGGVGVGGWYGDARFPSSAA